MVGSKSKSRTLAFYPPLLSDSAAQLTAPASRIRCLHATDGLSNWICGKAGCQSIAGPDLLKDGKRVSPDASRKASF